MRSSRSILSSVLLASFLVLPRARAHTSLLLPHSWHDPGGALGLADPKQSCNQDVILRLDYIPVTESPSGNCFWMTYNTVIPGERTLAPSMRTFPQLETNDDPSYDKHPWLAPGTAPVYSPCGAYYGNPYGCTSAPLGEVSLEAIKNGDVEEECNGDHAEKPYGPLAEDYYTSPGFADVVTTEWKAGSVAEVAFYLSGNHGGGYSYRLCKAPEEGMGGLTEECFQQSHLEFFGDKQWIHYNREDGSRTVIEVDALRTKEGTFPEGSQWTRHPVPACRFPAEAGPGGKLTMDPRSMVDGSWQDIQEWLMIASYPCPYGTQVQALSIIGLEM